MQRPPPSQLEWHNQPSRRLMWREGFLRKLLKTNPTLTFQHSPSLSALMQNSDQQISCSAWSRVSRWDRFKCVCVCVLRVRRASRCRSVCERATGWEVGPGLIRRRRQQSSSAPEWTAPDRLSSIPGTLPTTAGDWPAACQSARAPPPCPMGMQKQRRGESLFKYGFPRLF